MIRSEYPKKFRTCWAIARASSSFIPVRSMEFLIARVRSSTVRAEAGPLSVFVWMAMASHRSGALLPARCIYRFRADEPTMILNFRNDSAAGKAKTRRAQYPSIIRSLWGAARAAHDEAGGTAPGGDRLPEGPAPGGGSPLGRDSPRTEEL